MPSGAVSAVTRPAHSVSPSRASVSSRPAPRSPVARDEGGEELDRRGRVARAAPAVAADARLEEPAGAAFEDLGPDAGLEQRVEHLGGRRDRVVLPARRVGAVRRPTTRGGRPSRCASSSRRPRSGGDEIVSPRAPRRPAGAAPAPGAEGSRQSAPSGAGSAPSSSRPAPPARARCDAWVAGSAGSADPPAGRFSRPAPRASRSARGRRWSGLAARRRESPRTTSAVMPGSVASCSHQPKPPSGCCRVCSRFTPASIMASSSAARAGRSRPSAVSASCAATSGTKRLSVCSVQPYG